MPIGIQTSSDSLNNVAGQTALLLRNACRAAQALNEYVTTIGAGGLESLGFSVGDATAFTTAVNYMNTVAALFYGTASQPTDFDFDNAISVLYGGT